MVVQKKPAGQALQATLLELLAKVPEGHLVQLALPRTLEKVPGVQSVQDQGMEGAVMYMPTGQPAPTAVVLPAGQEAAVWQGVGAAALSGHQLPAGHCAQG